MSTTISSPGTGSTPYKKSPSATYDGDYVMLLLFGGGDDNKPMLDHPQLMGTAYVNGAYFLIAYGECNIDYYSKQGLTDVSPDP